MNANPSRTDGWGARSEGERAEPARSLFDWATGEIVWDPPASQGHKGVEGTPEAQSAGLGSPHAGVQSWGRPPLCQSWVPAPLPLPSQPGLPASSSVPGGAALCPLPPSPVPVVPQTPSGRCRPAPSPAPAVHPLPRAWSGSPPASLPRGPPGPPGQPFREPGFYCGAVPAQLRVTVGRGRHWQAWRTRASGSRRLHRFFPETFREAQLGRPQNPAPRRAPQAPLSPGLGASLACLHSPTVYTTHLGDG